MKRFYWQPNDMDEFIKMLRNFIDSKAELKNRELCNVLDMLSQWKWDNKLNIVAEVETESRKVGFSLEWGFPEGERISRDKLWLLMEHQQGGDYIKRFSFKTEISHSAQEAVFKALCHSLGFNEFRDEREKGRRTYANISINETYEGDTRTYRFSSDDYLFGRGDDYKKVDFDLFTDIIWAVNTLNLSDILEPWQRRKVH